MKTIKNRVATLAAFVSFSFFTFPSSVLAQDCDRQCLINLADDYVSALVAGDPGQAPLADDIHMVENVTRIEPGEGLWNTAAEGPEDFVIRVPDPRSQQVGYLAVIYEESDGETQPIQFGLRLKLDDGRITEAEHLIVRNLSPDVMDHLEAPRAPLVSNVDKRLRNAYPWLLDIGASYYDALNRNNGRLAPFADDCVRFENGMQTARNEVNREDAGSFGLVGALGCEAQLDTNFFAYITAIDNRRVIADEKTGLVFGLSHFRHSLEDKEFPLFNLPDQETRVMDNDPFDMPAIHIYKVWGGKIHEIEAIGILVPYMSDTGWE